MSLEPLLARIRRGGMVADRVAPSRAGSKSSGAEQQGLIAYIAPWPPAELPPRPRLSGRAKVRYFASTHATRSRPR